MGEFGGFVQTKMKISILCNDGSPLGVTYESLWGDEFRVGVGGAELALLTMAHHWTKEGHEVVLYNDPWRPTEYIDQRKIRDFDPQEERDYLIIFRSPNRLSYDAKGKKIWWSCDQFTIGDFREFGKTVDQIVTISPYHERYFLEKYDLKSTVIDLAVRGEDYKEADPYLKVPYRMLFSSVPGRGLDIMARMYPRIRQRVPEVSLVITSDYRLWGVSPQNQEFRSMFMGAEGVQFLGAVPRSKLVQEQIKAELQVSPIRYEELFCYAVAEAQYAYALPITPSMGALDSTNMGIKVSGNPSDQHWQNLYVDMAVKTLQEREFLTDLRSAAGKVARERFDIDRVSAQWTELVFNE